MGVKEWAKQVFIPYGIDMELMAWMGGATKLMSYCCFDPEYMEFEMEFRDIIGIPLWSVPVLISYAGFAITRAIDYDGDNPPNFGFLPPMFGPYKKKAKDLRAEGKESLFPDSIFDFVAESNAFSTNRLDRMLNDVYKKIREQNR